MRRALAVAALVATGVLLPAAPASASTTYYCGHGTHWWWTHRVSYLEHTAGSKSHVVWVHEGWRAYTRTVWCGHYLH